MYECTICLSLNHLTRLHCSICGTIPAMYSIIGKPSSSEYEGVPVACARNCERASQRRAARMGLKTVSLDYYSEV